MSITIDTPAVIETARGTDEAAWGDTEDAQRRDARERARAKRRAPGVGHLHKPLTGWLQRHDEGQRDAGRAIEDDRPATEALYAGVSCGSLRGLVHALAVYRASLSGACVPVTSAAACGQRLNASWRVATRDRPIACGSCLWHMENACVDHVEFD